MIIWGLIFVTKQQPETFTSDDCQNTLIKDGNTIFLYNSRKSTVPGINPIKLKNLEEYRQYISWQRANNINCPILHLEKIYTTQGTEMYEIRQNFMTPNNEAGNNPDYLDSKKSCYSSSTKFNTNQYPGFDPNNQTEGNPETMALALK
jgi:hypothetical protein